ncbi:MAG: aminodeoxychorismate/anthranilate synthase component II [Thermoanaerobaculales bacterium]|nr:aminodeoxychorismate/anthranilate synthase component II [Thermoanaerobaculales bacterium]
MILMLDNYDSFTYNLVQELQEISGAEMQVIRNDVETPEELLRRRPKAVVISPGPGTPEDAGVTLDLIRAAKDLPLLGICLGHQALAQVHGARIVRAPEPVHGKTSEIHHDGSTLFAHLENPIEATRYHSLIAARDTVPEELRITAWTEDGLVMAVEHRDRSHFGVQFHPESYLSLCGMDILARFLKRANVTLKPEWEERLTQTSHNLSTAGRA